MAISLRNPSRRVATGCSAARKPYDLAVATILLRAFAIVATFEFSSDGSFDEDIWGDAIKFYFDLFGEPAKLPEER